MELTAGDIRAAVARQFGTQVQQWSIHGHSRVRARLSVVSLDDLVAVAEYDLQQRLGVQTSGLHISVVRPPAPVTAPAAFDMSISAEPLVHQLGVRCPTV